MIEDLENYKIFYFVGKYQNITKAAKELYLSQPTVTKELHSFEEALGCKLVERASKGIRLTPEGVVLYEKTAPLLEGIFAAEKATKRSTHKEQGTIVMGFNTQSVRPLVMKYLSRCREIYPNVQILHMIATRNILDAALEDNIADIGFSFRPCDGDKDIFTREAFMKTHHSSYRWAPEMDRYRLFKSPYIMFCSKNSRELVNTKMITREILDDHSLTIHLENDSYVVRSFKEALRPDSGFRETDFLLPDCDSVLRMVKANNSTIGVICEKFIEKELMSGEFIKLESEIELGTFELLMYLSKLNPRSQLVKDIMNLILTMNETKPEIVEVDAKFQK